MENQSPILLLTSENFLNIVSLAIHWTNFWGIASSVDAMMTTSSNILTKHEWAEGSAKDLLKPDSAQVNSLKGQWDPNITRDCAVSNKCYRCPGAHSLAVCQFKILSVHSVTKQGTLQELVMLNKVLYNRTLTKVHTLHVGKTRKTLQNEHIKSLILKLTTPPMNWHIHCLTWTAMV